MPREQVRPRLLNPYNDLSYSQSLARSFSSETRFTVREFTYDESALQKQEEELKQLEQSEKELYAELLRLTRINFSEAFQAWVHLKVLRAFIESVLRYGLPANYFAAVLKVYLSPVTRLLSTQVAYTDTFPLCSP